MGIIGPVNMEVSPLAFAASGVRVAFMVTFQHRRKYDPRVPGGAAPRASAESPRHPPYAGRGTARLRCDLTAHYASAYGTRTPERLRSKFRSRARRRLMTRCPAGS